MKEKWLILPLLVLIVGFTVWGIWKVLQVGNKTEDLKVAVQEEKIPGYTVENTTEDIMENTVEMVQGSNGIESTMRELEQFETLTSGVTENPFDSDTFDIDAEIEIGNSVGQSEEKTDDKVQDKKETTSASSSTLNQQSSSGLKEPEAPSNSGTGQSSSQKNEEDKEKTEYEKFQEMSASDQHAYMNSFESVDAFFEWYNAAQAEYEATKNEIVVGSGSINFEEIIENNDN